MKNYNSRDINSDIYNVCNTCGNNAAEISGTKISDGCHTVSTGICDICSRKTIVGNPRIYGYPDFTLLVNDIDIGK